jgi:hypothetical protein
MILSGEGDSMRLYWKIRYLDRSDKKFKDRHLYLRTETLDPATKAAVELITEAKSREDQRQILRFKSLFAERKLDTLPTNMDGIDQFRAFGLCEYFEDETGAEIKQHELWAYLKPVDAPELEPAPPVPVAEVFLTGDEIRLLGYFVRDHKELSDSALMKEGPGTITSPGDITPTGRKKYSFKTSLTDDEIRSCVTIHRRLYMEKEPANVEKAVALFVGALGDHPYARCVAGFAAQYRKQLDSPPNLPMLMPGTTYGFTTKRLIDVFLYTQYAHQPDEKRQRQFAECLNDVQGDRGVLTCLFLSSLWETGIHIGNAGRWIDQWFQHYCSHHQITPDVLNSLRHEEVGIGAQEKERDRKVRLHREKSEKLATELWEQAGRPAGGPAQFYQVAGEQLRRALGGGWTG